MSRWLSAVPVQTALCCGLSSVFSSHYYHVLLFLTLFFSKKNPLQWIKTGQCHPLYTDLTLSPIALMSLGILTYFWRSEWFLRCRSREEKRFQIKVKWISPRPWLQTSIQNGSIKTGQCHPQHPDVTHAWCAWAWSWVGPWTFVIILNKPVSVFWVWFFSTLVSFYCFLPSVSFRAHVPVWHSDSWQIMQCECVSVRITLPQSILPRFQNDKSRK